MKTSQFLSLSLGGLCVLAFAAVSLYYNAKKDETIAVLSGKLLEMESRVTALEVLPSHVMALETLPARLDAVESMSPRVAALEGIPPRIAALETLPPRMLAAEKLAERVAALETLNRAHGEQLDKLTSVSPAFAPHADIRLRQAANRLVQYGIVRGKGADSDFMDNLARLENGDGNIKEYPFIVSMLSYGTPGKAVPASCVRAFLEAGADPNAADEDGATALMHAVWQQDPEVVRLLISVGADVNAADKDGNTALMAAVEDGNCLGIVKELLAAGADAGAKNADGDTALDLCADEKAAGLLKAAAPPAEKAAEEVPATAPVPGSAAAPVPAPESAPAQPSADAEAEPAPAGKPATDVQG